MKLQPWGATCLGPRTALAVCVCVYACTCERGVFVCMKDGDGGGTAAAIPILCPYIFY